jgi:hypothetical protein
VLYFQIKELKTVTYKEYKKLMNSKLPNQPKSQILLHKNILPQDLYIITLMAVQNICKQKILLHVTQEMLISR